ncbi:MAG: hypothetical protein JNJ54_19015 [Myxococcaceae bacterium]|nr:hypothetical protein [Myxococcaceae bacterium]
MRALWCLALFAACSPPVMTMDGGVEDAGVDAGIVVDAGMDAGSMGLVDAGLPKECVPDNSDAGLARRDGFIEVCADPVMHPDAVCGDGAPYKFSYRPAQGASKGLLLFFRGGGSCNDYTTCWGVDGRGGAGRRVGQMENTRNTAPPVIPALGRTVGLFDRSEALNPFRQYDQVFISYCTGDIGQGMTSQVLPRPSNAPPAAPVEIETFFHGAYDVQFALEQMAVVFPSPPRIVVYGTSAGALSAVNAVPWVATVFALDSTSQLNLITEGGMAVGRQAQELLLERILTQFNGTGGRPFVRVGQFSFISDETQIAFAPPSLMVPLDFQTELRRATEQRRTNTAAYRHFLVDGACHTVAQTPGYFAQFEAVDGGLRLKMPPVKPNPDLTIMGTSFDTWVGRIVSGQGAMDGGIPNLNGDLTAVSTTCRIPGSVDR